MSSQRHLFHWIQAALAPQIQQAAATRRKQNKTNWKTRVRPSGAFTQSAAVQAKGRSSDDMTDTLRRTCLLIAAVSLLSWIPAKNCYRTTGRTNVGRYGGMNRPLELIYQFAGIDACTPYTDAGKSFLISKR